jgi:hypothetical protein
MQALDGVVERRLALHGAKVIASGHRPRSLRVGRVVVET